MATSKKTLKGHIVSQTHWDREWYLPFEEFRFHLVRLMDRVLDIFEKEPEYQHFVSDGQTIILEDYLEIRPDKEKAIRQYVESGRLAIGPWYVLPDEYIVSAESLVRNLLMGARVARRFGKPSSAGYVPDPFGHVAQLPRILRGVDIDNFIFLRGMPRAEKYGTEFRWVAPGGDVDVLAIWMKNIYFNASLLGYDIGWGDSEAIKDQFSLEKALSQLDGQVNDLSKWSRCGVLLFNNGCDHTPPQYEIPQIVRAANKHFDSIKFVHSTYDAFVADVKKAKAELAEYQGELRSSCYIAILPNVLSTRMYLKQMNRQCEKLLERWAEPLSALLRHIQGIDHHPHILQAWKLLLQNHPHDSICGCSVDSVHREMVTRYEKIEQIARTVINDAARHLQRKINTSNESAFRALIAWNPLACRRRGPLRATLSLAEKEAGPFTIMDEQGNAVPFQISNSGTRREVEYLRFNEPFKDFDLTIERDAAGIGYQTLWLARRKKWPTRDASWIKAATRDKAETPYYRLRFNANGSFDVYDKANKVWHKDQHIFEDIEDIGDEYDYSHAKNGKRLTTEKCKAKVKVVERGSVFVEYQITIPWKIPARINDKRTKRSNETVGMTIHTRLRLYRHHRRIDLTSEFDNKAKDHRLRVLFDMPAKAKDALADGHFAHIRRPFQEKTTKKHDSPEPTTHHMRFFVALADAKHGLAVLNRELLEYEVLSSSKNKKTVAITLLRCVNYLMGEGLLTVPHKPGPAMETPEAQCPGFYRTEYALLPFAAKEKPSAITPEAESFAAPVMFATEELHPGKEPSKRSFIECDNENLVLSTWKPSEAGSGSIVRFYNPGSSTLTANVELDATLKWGGPCKLNEKPIEDKNLEEIGREPVSVDGYRILSWRIK